MDKKSKILIWIFVILTVASVGYTFYNIYINKNYQISSEVSCDPSYESCFVYKCELEDEECLVDSVDGVIYYKIINKKASNIDLCLRTEQKLGCGEELSCVDQESDCSYTYCSVETGDDCSNIVAENESDF